MAVDTIQAVIIGLSAVSALSLVVGLSIKELWIKFLAYGNAMIQVLVLLICLWFTEATESITGILRVDFLVMMVVCLFIGLVKTYDFTIELMSDIFSPSKKRDWNNRGGGWQ